MRDGIQGLYEAHYAAEATKLGPAIFLAMCNYLRATAKGEDDADGSQYSVALALAEAYVIHAGTWLAHLDHRDRTDLGTRIVEVVVMTADEWSWVTGMIQLLA